MYKKGLTREELEILQEQVNIKRKTEINNWVNSQMTAFKGSQKDVLTFIAEILYHQSNEDSEIIRSLFCGGYCYYFAKMLENAFGGEVCWHKGFSHIVWKDTRPGEGFDIIYDIDGVFYEYGEDDIVPVDFLKAELESFRHRGKDLDVINDIKETANQLGVFEDKLMEDVYEKIPEGDRVFDKYNIGDARRYWWIYKENYLDKN